jgi:uncharacterized membrane protein YesL
MRLNLLFLFLALIGLGVFGFGPAYYAIVSLFQEGQWDLKKQKKMFSRGWAFYKEEFFRINRISLSYLAAIIILAINLVIAVHQKGMLFFSLTLFIIFFMIALALAFQYAIFLETRYVMSMKNNFMIAIAAIFANMKELVVQIGGTIVIAIVTLKFPALILFGAFALQMVWSTYTFQKRFLWINQSIKG